MGTDGPAPLAMRIAVLSDIHGNVRALEAVLADIDHQNVDEIVNLGDCAYGPFDPSPVMDWLMTNDIPTVRGNEDVVLAAGPAGQEPRMAPFCRSRLSPSALTWLDALPLVRTVSGALLFHGTPRNESTYLLTAVTQNGPRTRPREEIAAMLPGISAPLLLCGHDHTPRHIQLANGTHIANPGSVGCPAYADDVPAPHAIENGTPHARYALIDLGNSSLEVALLTIAYDSAAAADEAMSNGFPDWAQWLASGRVT